MNILIVEDEKLAQEELARLIQTNYPTFNIVKCIDSVKESVEWLSNHSVDLIFMDIQLSDGICFDIFDKVEINIPIIFTTAYDKYAIRAFDVNGIGYLLKPIIEVDLQKAVHRFKSYNLPVNNNVISSIVENLQSIPKQEYKSRFLVKSGDKFFSINIDEVAYIYAEDNVCFLMTHEGKRYIIDYSIESLEPLLNPLKFFRITRGCIACMQSINKVSKYFNSRLKVSLTPAFPKELLISRLKVPSFLKWLDGN
jgi:DNA-binding LytR/AlgR family response regulator